MTTETDRIETQITDSAIPFAVASIVAQAIQRDILSHRSDDDVRVVAIRATGRVYSVHFRPGANGATDILKTEVRDANYSEEKSDSIPEEITSRDQLSGLSAADILKLLNEGKLDGLRGKK